MLAKEALPKYREFMQPTLKALHDLGGSGSIPEINEKAISYMDLSSGMLAVPHGNTQTTEVEYRLYWARTYLKMVSLIDNSERGIWALTAKGRATREIDSKQIVNEVRKLLQRPRLKASETAPLPSEEDNAEEEKRWSDLLLERLLAMPPAAFERLCQRILREAGFIQVEVTGRSGDGGIDGRGVVRVAGLISFNVLFQSKRHKGSLGANVVRDFRGAMIGRADKGLLITTGTFTPDALKEATRDGAPPIDLIDGEQLTQKLKELNLGVHSKMVEAVEVDSKWFDSI